MGQKVKTQRKQYKNKRENKHHLKQKEPTLLSDRLHSQFSIGRTPFRPPVGEHAALLARTNSDYQRASMAIQLQRAYGNRYLQHLLNSKKVPVKLSVSKPDDAYEREADRVADTLTKSVTPPGSHQEIAREEELQAKIVEHVRRAATDTVPRVGSEIEQQINVTRGNGEPLEDNLRRSMEPAFGTSFSEVRIHKDAVADKLSQSLKARAFTTRKDIFFRNNEYNPETSSGKQLITHELTHVVQQGGGRALRPDEPNNASVPIEGEIHQKAAIQRAPRKKGKLVKKRLQQYEKAIREAGGTKRPVITKPPGEQKRKTKQTKGPESVAEPEYKSPQGKKRAKEAKEWQPTDEAPKTTGSLISAEEFAKKTRLTFSWLGRKGKSGPFFSEVVKSLKEYRSKSSYEAKRNHLLDLSQKVQTWLDSGRKSSRKKHVEALRIDVVTEIDRLLIDRMLPGLQKYYNLERPADKMKLLAKLIRYISGPQVKREDYPDYDENRLKSRLISDAMRLENALVRLLTEAEGTSWFNDLGYSTYLENAAGGQLNKLDLVTYKFGIRKTGKGFEKVEGKKGNKFTGYFKPAQGVDPEAWSHRGTKKGMPQMLPGFHRRTLAMYKLDQLLGANVIPPTFLAKHNDQIGTVMQKIEGNSYYQKITTGEKGHETNFSLKAEASVAFRKSLSNLYLLDIIAGQVDRHSGNFMVEMEGGVIKGVKGVDLDLAFGEGYTGEMIGSTKGELDVAGKTASELKEIDQKLAMSIINAAANKKDVQDALTGFLNEEEIQATIDRLTKLAEFLTPLIGKDSGPIITEWK